MNETSSAWLARQHQEQKRRLNDHRDVFQRDRARILHSAAFRRLQAKTQIHGTGSNDFHRTRLTHSLEAAQIGSGILAQLTSKPVPTKCQPWLDSPSLIEALCLAHDIGHPPFGHGGEIALNYMMRNHGGFEGNAQTFRIVNHLEPYTKEHGMNLSRRTVLGLVKYPALLSEVHKSNQMHDIDNPRQLKASDWAPAKGIYDCDLNDWQWMLEPLTEQDQSELRRIAFSGDDSRHSKTQYKSLDCSIMELADDIAYGVHDLEDAIVLGKVHKAQWMEHGASRLATCGDVWFEQNIGRISEQLFSGEHYLRKDAIGGIVNALLTDAHIHENPQFEHPLLRHNARLSDPIAQALTVFKQFVSQFVIQVPDVQIIEYRGQQILLELSEALISDPERLLPEATRLRWQAESSESDSRGMRVLCDYISAMTDGYAQKLHSQLFSSSYKS